MTEKLMPSNKFGVRANIALVATGTILGALYGMGDQLPLTDAMLEYIKMGANFLGLLTGMVFISSDKKRLIRDEDLNGMNGVKKDQVSKF